jgi:hypothetical protein
MNANELADELESCDEYEMVEFVRRTKVSTMLRQQQAEIERLSNDNYKFIKAMANKDSHIESLKQLLNDSVLRKAQEK